ncbi:MAG TPA: amidohydrolase family protein [Jatrophihabitantaceae bacterium]|jgi:predicted TIM-barrel fold metal-dependent hydrolase|nr:amidohydrolase family protein [Jatrophihabitantaceae bacterium]
MGFIDCDSHVIETEETWSYLAESERRFEPVRARIPQGNTGAVERALAPQMDLWMIGDTWCTAIPLDGSSRGNGNRFADGTGTLSSIPNRIEDLDGLGIDAQLVLSSFFIGIELDNGAADVAIARAYNRWVADRLGNSQHGGRLQWAIRPPMRSIPHAIDELKFGKEHGAVGAQLRGIECGLYLSDPYFFPFYEAANDLEMVIVVHVGEALRRIDHQMIGRVVPSPASMTRQLFPLMAGFHAILASDFEKRFPKIKWAFVEGGASWVPTVLQTDARLDASGGDFLNPRPAGPEVLEEKQMFVAAFADDPLDYLINIVGENVLVAGTDYCHNDLGSEVGSHTAILGRKDLPSGVAQKIVSTNPRRLLGIAEDFLPARTGTGGPPHIHGASTADGSPILYHRQFAMASNAGA